MTRKKKSKRKIISQPNKNPFLSNNERAARLAALLTIIGGLVYLLIKLLIILSTIFSTKLYMKFPFGYEHIFITSLVTLLILMIGHLVIQVLYDAYTYNGYFGNENNDGMMFKYALQADKMYYFMFFAMKRYFLLIVFINVIFVLSTQIFLGNKIVFWGTILFMILFIILSVFNWEKIVVLGIDLIKNQKYYIGSLFFLFFIFVIGVTYIEQSKSLMVTFENTSKNELTLVIKSENFSPDNIQIEYFKENNKREINFNTSRTVKSEDFRIALMDNTQESILNKNSLTLAVNEQFSKNNKAALINKSSSTYIFKENIIKNINEGENYIVLTVDVSRLGIKDNIRIVNQIHLDDNGLITSTKNEFKWNFK